MEKFAGRNKGKIRRTGRQYPEVKKPQISIAQIPEDITLDNVEVTLSRQNPEKDMKVGDTKAKFRYVTKRKTRNMVIEVDTSNRGKLMTTRIKLGWAICRVDDYIVAKSCYRCSRYNHTSRECKSDETCPLCPGGHRLKDCTANKTVQMHQLHHAQ